MARTTAKHTVRPVSRPTSEMLERWLRYELRLSDGSRPERLLEHAPIVHVMSATNPGGHPATRRANAAADARFVRMARRHRLGLVACTGYDPISSDSEDGWAVTGLTREGAYAWAAHFGQAAFYEIGPDGPELLVTDDPAAPRERPMHLQLVR